jgi:hypothetical protein
MKFVVFLAAFLLAVSGLFFDSHWVKSLPIAYPIIFLALGLVSVGLLLLALFGRKQNQKPVIFVLAFFFLFLIIGLFSSTLSSAGDFLALGMKVPSTVVNFLFFYVG